MDEDKYKCVRNNEAPIACAFEKSILALRLCCSMANKINIAEREVIRCEADEFQLECCEWLRILRNKSKFSLQLTDIVDFDKALPHAKEMKVQVGGIRGLVLLLEKEGRELTNRKVGLPDVFLTLTESRKRYGRYGDFPFGQLVKSVASFSLRKD